MSRVIFLIDVNSAFLSWTAVKMVMRQVGLGVSKLTHETVEQMSLFEDPKMEYYRAWDRQYDAERAEDDHSNQ